MTSAADAERIDPMLAELRRVWRRNPAKSLSHVVAKAQSLTGNFTPDDVTDEQMLAALQGIGRGLPAPD